MKQEWRNIILLVLGAISLALISCGGGGGDNTVQPSPVETSSNNAPTKTSDTLIYVPENTTSVLMVTGSDPEGDILSFSITGGLDQAAFSIDPDSGVLTFLTAPDYENPTDYDSNNTYLVEVTVTDGINNVSQLITATVTNDTAPQAPSLNVSYGPKELRFSWASIASATQYRLLESLDGSTYNQKETVGNLATNINIPEISVHKFNWSRELV